MGEERHPKHPKIKNNSSKINVKKFLGILDRILQYYPLSMPLFFIIALLIFVEWLTSIGVESSFTDPVFKIGLYFAIWGFSLTLLNSINTDRKIEKLEKKFSNSSVTNEVIQKETVTLKKQKSYRTHLILGILIIIVGLLFFVIPISNDRPEIDRWSGFDIARQENVTLSSLSFNIVTLEEKQNLHIFYATYEIHGETPFLMFFIPYLGTLVNPQGDPYSIPGEWKTYQDPGLKTTILYKFFDCTDEEYCNDQLNMYFDFDYKIDSKQYYTHSINIPFLSPHHSPLNNARNEILSDIPVAYWEENWGLREGQNPILTVSVLDDSTQYNAIPDGYLKSHKHNRTGVTNSVMVWNVPDHPIDFHLDYVNPHEKYFYDNLRTIAVVLFATGTAFLTISFSEYRSQKKFN